MQFKTYLFFRLYVVFYNEFKLINAKALVGYNIREANNGEFSFVVSISRLNTQNLLHITHICTGTLTSKRDVLSVAHCLLNQELNSVQIIVNSVNLNLGIKHYPAWWVTYEMWAAQRSIPSKKQDDDIVMIRLTEPVVDSMSPATLQLIPNHRLFGLNVHIASWGKLISGQLPMIMRVGTLTVLSNIQCEERCSRISTKKIKLEESTLCTVGDPYILLHSGDSGSPLLHQGGVVAISKGLCPTCTKKKLDPKKINIHISLLYYQHFINNIIHNY